METIDVCQREKSDRRPPSKFEEYGIIFVNCYIRARKMTVVVIVCSHASSTKDSFSMGIKISP